MRAAEFREKTILGWKEQQLQEQIITLAEGLGFKTYHPYDSRRSNPGWPDLVLAHPRSGALIFRELKKEDNYPTPEQREWIETLRGCGQDVGVWKPRDWASGRIERELRAGASGRR